MLQDGPSLRCPDRFSVKVEGNGIESEACMIQFGSRVSCADVEIEPRKPAHRPSGSGCYDGTGFSKAARSVDGDGTERRPNVLVLSCQDLGACPVKGPSWVIAFWMRLTTESNITKVSFLGALYE